MCVIHVLGRTEEGSWILSPHNASSSNTQWLRTCYLCLESVSRKVYASRHVRFGEEDFSFNFRLFRDREENKGYNPNFKIGNKEDPRHSANGPEESRSVAITPIIESIRLDRAIIESPANTFSPVTIT